MTKFWIVASLCWWLVGAGSFVYWWTTAHDLTVYQIPVMILAGGAGPASFLIGFSIHGKSIPKPWVLIERQT